MLRIIKMTLKSYVKIVIYYKQKTCELKIVLRLKGSEKNIIKINIF